MKLEGKRNKLALIFSILKTIYFNFRAFKFRTAIHLPVFVANNTTVRRISKDCIVLNNWEEKHYRVYFGFSGSDNVCANRHSYILIDKESKIEFNGSAAFSKGCSIAVWGNGILEIGDNFSANRNCAFDCQKNIKIGDDCLLGWNINVRDSDGSNHIVYQDGNPKESRKAVEICNHVWLGSYSSILKGTIIGSNSIVAWGSVVTKSFVEDNVLIGGTPAKKITDNISWEGYEKF